MAYFFPIGAAEGLVTQSISYAILATSASAAQFQTISVATASYAMTSGSIPQNGTFGISKTEGDCSATAPRGNQGSNGTSGRKGLDSTACPENTIECTSLFTQLNTNINPNVPSGSQYSKVCMEIPNGCELINVVCPPTLPIAYPAILPNPFK